MNSQTKKLNNDGVILVFTLILMAALLSTALGFAYFIIGDINKARAIDDSIIAYYAADAGLEGSLYALRKQDIQSIETLKLIPGRLEGVMVTSTATWSIANSTDYESSVLRQRLYNGQSVKFFILNRATTNNTKSITVEWYKGEGTAPKMQVNLTQLKPQSDPNNPGVLVFYTDLSQVEISDSAGGIKCFNLQDKNIDPASSAPLSPPVDYVAEMTVLGTNADFVDRLIVTAYNSIDCSGPNNSKGITNLTLKSRGTYNKSQQTIVAQILPKDPASGILGFVLFSDQDITK